MPSIKLGPAGIGPTKTAVQILHQYHDLGFKAAEISFTYNIYIKDQEDIKQIKQTAEKLNIQLSIHAPYFINLNSKEKSKIESSKKRILKCCEIGEQLGATKVVFHPGFYAGQDPETTYQNIKQQILDIQKTIKQKNYQIKLAPEIMGKVNVFGSPEQISKLAKETNCEFTIDFAHTLAREKSIDYNKLKKLFPQKDWHCHFSGIQYSEKGEQKHLKTKTSEWKQLLKNLPKDKNITIINESPDMINDTEEGLKLSKE
jgi:deoxyribonuclease-4